MIHYDFSTTPGAIDPFCGARLVDGDSFVYLDAGWPVKSEAVNCPLCQKDFATDYGDGKPVLQIHDEAV